jgi:hypothetical protein
VRDIPSGRHMRDGRGVPGAGYATRARRRDQGGARPLLQRPNREFTASSFRTQDDSWCLSAMTGDGLADQSGTVVAGSAPVSRSSLFRLRPQSFLRLTGPGQTAAQSSAVGSSLTETGNPRPEERRGGRWLLDLLIGPLRDVGTADERVGLA